jgi:hypothetical protein
MMYRGRSAFNPCSSTTPSFLPIEEDSCDPCPRYPLVDIEQDESLVLSKIPAPSPLGGHANAGLLNDRRNAGRQRKGQQGSRVLQSRIGSRGKVGIGR